MKEIIIGEIKGQPGKIIYDYLNILEHPIGTIERLPIIIAQGKTEGPILWLTANIHGDEYTGIPVIHNIVNNLDLNSLKGAIVAIPTLNPAGSRTTSRYPYYDKKDPNRLFPDGNPFKEKIEKETIETNKLILDEEQRFEDVSIFSEKSVKISIEEEKQKELDDSLNKYESDEFYPSIQELIWKKLFSYMKDSADYLIDLHNAFIKSIPFIFLDRVLYDPEKGEEAIFDAHELYNKTEELVNAFGFTIVRETIPKKYIQKKLHRSTSGAALNYLRIPSFTVELGMYREVEEEVVKAAVVGVTNVMKITGMVNGEIESITNIPVIAQGQAVRHIGHPRMPSAAIIEIKVQKGDFVKKGDLIAIARDIFGRPIQEGSEIRTEIDGYVFMINEGIVRYQNEELLWLATEDDKPMVDKWPKNK
ncbi:MAG: succinylglutamate desuccinylase/aspartoacylase family protein [Candidatus Heimdallarchaeota archaeon]|nr:succinylglutamate desuccinylase/aspartoacylase family protein [Candidatus Heimdallarchaeota archaeon]